MDWFPRPVLPFLNFRLLLATTLSLSLSLSFAFLCAVFGGLISRVVGRQSVRKKKWDKVRGKRVLSCGHTKKPRTKIIADRLCRSVFLPPGNRYHVSVECLIPFIVVQVETRSENGHHGPGALMNVKRGKQYGIWVGPEKKCKGK